ncbi:MAG: cation transporter [Bacillota bacterium]
MRNFTQDQSASRQKTLLIALLLSMWAPLVTGIAVVMSTSTTQLADFVRRTAELIALFVSWWVFRYIARNESLDQGKIVALEKISGLFVAAAIGTSASVMLALIIVRMGTVEPGGNVYPGLIIATLGVIVNTWFWRRYARLNQEQYSSIINAQRQLYQAKTLVDLLVIAALGAVAIAPDHYLTYYIDLIGSFALVGYLFWNGLRTIGQTIKHSK